MTTVCQHETSFQAIFRFFFQSVLSRRPVGIFPGDYDGEFHLKRTQAFRCVSEIHEGDWLFIGKTYGLIAKYAGTNGLKLNANSREVYTHVDLDDPSANVTEIQVGIE